MDYGLLIMDDGFLIMDYGLLIMDYGLLIMDYGLLIKNYGLLIMDYGFIAKHKFDVLKTRNFDTLYEPPPSGYRPETAKTCVSAWFWPYFCRSQPFFANNFFNNYFLI